MHLDLLPDLIGARLASQVSLATSNSISLGLIVAEIGPLSEVGLHTCHVLHTHCADFWLARSFHYRPYIAS
jgi:hypothetical protein